MNANTRETVPQTWDDSRDVAFFRCVDGLFAADYLYGSSVLLASYDVEAETAAQPVTATVVPQPQPTESAPSVQPAG